MKYENLIIDGPYLAHRSWDAPYNLVSNGEKITMIHSFIMSLQSLRKKFLPRNTSLAWESHGTESWRKVIYKDYKPSYLPPPGYLSQQENLQRLLHLLGFPQYWSPGNEADDVVGTLAQSPSNSVIFTVDKDICQVVNEHCHVWTGHDLLDPVTVELKYKVRPEQIPHLLAITGDPSDAIPGFRGYGLKKASDILKKYNTIDQIPGNYNLDSHILQRNLQLTKLNNYCRLLLYELDDKTATIDGILDHYNLYNLKKSIDKFRNIPNKVTSLSDFY